jgi:hypothetical protein
VSIRFFHGIYVPRSPKFVPSFAWLEGDVAQHYDERHGLQVACKVMTRRYKSMSPAEERLFRSIQKVARTIDRHPKLVLERKNRSV